jgi:hypothetical protein
MATNTSAIFGCVALFPLAIWIIALTHWMVGAELDVRLGLVGIALGLLLGFVAMAPPIPMLSPIAFCLIFGTVIFFPFLTAALHSRQLKSIDAEAVEKAYAAIGQRPDNAFAKFKLAESIYRLGYIGHGVAIAEAALGTIPDRISRDERRMFNRWIAAGVPPDTLKPIQCIDCRSMCEPGWTHCRKCGSPFLLDKVKGKIMPTGHAKVLMSIWVSIVLCCLGIPCTTVLPWFLALPAIVAFLGIGIGFVVLTFRATQDAQN